MPDPSAPPPEPEVPAPPDSPSAAPPEADPLPDPPPPEPGTGMVRDSVQTFFAQLATIVVSIASSVILGRTIAPTGKALLTILILIPKSAWSFGTLGLDQVNTVYAGRDRERRHELATTTMVLGLLISVIAYVLVAVLIYWPGRGAAKAGLKPGDFLLAVDGQPLDEGGYARLRAAADEPGGRLSLTVWRQETIQELELPIEPRGPRGLVVQDFRLSALNMWRYGLGINPQFARQWWLPALDCGFVPLGTAQWRELEARTERGLWPADLILPQVRYAALVGDVGTGRLARNRHPLQAGDIVLSAYGVPLRHAARAPWGFDLDTHQPLTLDIWRKGQRLTVTVPVDAGELNAPPEERPLNLSQTGLRELGLLRNLQWGEQAYAPALGLAYTPMSAAHRADLEHRKALGAFALGTTIPEQPAAIITQVDYPWLRRWSQDLPPGLFMLTMLFFPLTAAAYLMDSILYGLNLIKLRNQKSVITAAALAVLYAIGLWGYGVIHKGLTYRSAEGLMELLTIAIWLTLLHGAFILAYSWYLIAPRAKFARKYFNVPYVVQCFRHIGWQSYIANSASYLFYDVDVFIITSIIAAGTTTLTLDNLGNYTQATNIVERVWIIPGAIATSLLPKLTNFGVAKAGELTPKGIRHTLILTIAILVPLCFAMPWLVPFLWGPQFLPLLGPFYFLAPGILLFSLSKVYASHLLGIGLPKYAMWYSVLTVIVNVVLNLILIPLPLVIGGIPVGGINGAALASTIAYSLHSFLMLAAYCKEAQTTPAQVFRYTREDWALYGRGFQEVVRMVGKLKRA